MIENKRDLGGIYTMDGKCIRSGMLIRSARLEQAEQQDLRGISAVIDLRTGTERAKTADRTFDCLYFPIPVFEDMRPGISHEQQIEEDRKAREARKNQGQPEPVGKPTPPGGPKSSDGPKPAVRKIPDMAVMYRRLITECSDAFRRVLLQIMQHDFKSGAVLWHCTEGKDRCGLVSAMVLEMLGVSRDLIMEDYLKTNLVNRPKAAYIREQLLPEHGEAFADSVYRTIIADESYLQAAWEAMGEHYLEDRLHLTEDSQCAFRATVLQ